jgi:hypothetical protein
MNSTVASIQQITEGYGFNMINEKHQPLVTFEYASRIEAEYARTLLAKALENARHLTVHRASSG